MNVNDARAQVQERLGFRTDKAAEIVSRMAQVQRLLEQGRTLPWFLVTQSTPISVVASGNATLPTGFIREAEPPEFLGLYWTNDDGKIIHLRKMAATEALATYGAGDVSEEPVAYAIRETAFVLYPLTHSAVSLSVEYYKQDTVPAVGGAENKWLKYAPDLIIGNTGASFAKTLKNQSAYEECAQLAQVAWEALLKENIARSVTNRDFIFGRNS